MGSQRFDEWTKALAQAAGEDGLASRRRVVRGVLGGAAAALLGLGGARRATASHLLPGEACGGTADCSQVGGATTCADNGIAGDGALNCCRGGGGACTTGAGCCGGLVCADNGIAGDGALNCCHNEGGACTTGAGCCGSLLCVDGVCRSGAGPGTGGRDCKATGKACKKDGQCCSRACAGGTGGGSTAQGGGVCA